MRLVLLLPVESCRKNDKLVEFKLNSTQVSEPTGVRTLPVARIVRVLTVEQEHHSDIAYRSSSAAWMDSTLTTKIGEKFMDSLVNTTKIGKKFMDSLVNNALSGTNNNTSNGNGSNSNQYQEPRQYSGYQHITRRTDERLVAKTSCTAVRASYTSWLVTVSTLGSRDSVFG